ncbi:MAG: flippase [Geminicoccaceae bacterium]
MSWPRAGRPPFTSLLSSALAVFTIRAVLALAMFVTMTLLARILGPSGFGRYSTILAIVALAGLPLSMGIPQGIVQILPAALAGGPATAPAAAASWALRMTTFSGLAGGFFAIAIAGLLATLDLASFTHGAIIALCLPLAVVTLTCSGIIRGLDRPVLAMLPELLGRTGPLPAILLACIALGFTPDLDAALALQCLGMAAGCGLAFVFALDALDILPAGGRASGQSTEWLAICWPLMAVSIGGAVMTQADLVMVATLLGPEEAGLYRTAVLAALATPMALAALLQPAVPRMARLHARRDDRGLQVLTSSITLWASLLTLPVAGLLLIGAAPILTLAFGGDFAGASTSLRILVAGQFVNVLCGPVMVLLQVTGSQGLVARTFAICAGANLLLNAILIPTLGVDGAAAATVISMVSWNVHLVMAARRNRSISTSILACRALAPRAIFHPDASIKDVSA